MTSEISALPVRLRQKIYIEPNTGCWIWEGYHAPHGYGVISIGPQGGAKLHYLHRLVYQILVGPIAEGYQIDHLCRTRCCCNPAHLEAVIGRINYLRGVGPSAKHAKQTHCVNGHEFNEANTYYRARKEGGRQCRVCHRIAESLKRRSGVMTPPLTDREANFLG